MKALVQDVDALKALRPHDVAAYLRTRGWLLAETVGPFTRYTLETNGSKLDVEVPKASEYRDYPLRMAEVLSAIARAERRSQLEILQDLTMTSADVVRLRLIGGDLSDGSVLLEDGAQLVERARDVLLAAACATVQPRAFYGTRKPTEAVEYVRRLRLGQTEHGSYVVRVLSPVAPLLTVTEAGDVVPESLPLPFERRVTETLMIATAAASRAAVEAGATGDLAPFEQAVAAGASANLCEGFAGMLVDRPYTAIELSVGWSKNRPAPKKVERVVRLTRETAPLLVSASQELKARAPREDFELEGYVVDLHAEKPQETGGTIIVAAKVDGDTRRVRLSLSPTEYASALDAHGKTARVSCAGRLVKSGRQYELAEPRRFVILGDE